MSVVMMEMEDASWSKTRMLLSKVIREEGSKVTEVAKAMGVSHTAVSMYVNGKYRESEQIQRAAETYLRSIGKWVEDDELNPPEEGFINDISQLGTVITGDYHRVMGICSKCHERHEFGIVVGAPGLGKTKALEDYAQKHTGVVMITCDQTSSTKSILSELAEELNLDVRGTSATLVRRIVKELQRRPKLVIVDEADKARLVVLETLRGIYDKAKKVGVVLCGNQPLAEQIIILAEDRPELARLRDRLGYYTTTKGVTDEEAGEFLSKVNMSPAARKMMVDVAINRGVRQLVKSLDRMLEVTKGKRITEDLVQDLGQIYLGFNA